MGSRNDLYEPVPWQNAIEWRRIIGSPYCPLRPGVKFLLTALSRYGDRWGQNIYPSQRELAYCAGVSPKTVNKALKLADKEGWIIRKEMGSQNGKGYKHHVYELAVPAYVYDNVSDKLNFWKPPYTEKIVKKGDCVGIVKRCPQG